MKSMALEKQMELFDEGGLLDEGGTKDPVSGNDVPIGSLQEEVRDDIPAQLSEGEFVMPADVVRYHGLDKMMALRDEAKMGLRRMEAMGQMGNSEEATLPDDVPFGLEDLDIAEEPLEMQVGGFVPTAPQFTPGGVQQSQFQNYTPQFTPYQPPQILPMPQAPQQTFTPMAPTNIPQFNQFVTPTYVTYVNDEGNAIQIPVDANGKPLIPVPAGFKKQTDTPNEMSTDPVITESTAPETTSVRQPEGGDDEARIRREEEMYGPGGGRLGVQGNIYGVSFDVGEGGILSGLKNRGSIISGLAFGGKIPEKIAGDVTVNFKRGDTEFAVDGINYNELKDVIQTYGANSPNAQRKITELQNISKAVVSSERERGREVEAVGEDFADTAGPGSGMAPQTLTAAERRRAAQKERERELEEARESEVTGRDFGDYLQSSRAERAEEEARREAARQARENAARRERAETERQEKARQAQERAEERAKVEREQREQRAEVARDNQRQADAAAGQGGGFGGSRDTQSGATGGGFGGGFGERGRRAKGGLMEAPKPKTKKMKQAGLASKK